jgi:site-specific DNA recombinase
VSPSPESHDALLRAGLYCRVSNDPSGRGASVADQEKEGRRWCEDNGYTIAWVIVDNDLSASKGAKERPGYVKVKANLTGTDPVDVLVAWESSRLQRDLDMYVEMRNLFENSNTLLSYNGRLYDMSRIDDRFTTGLDALIDERYSGEIRKRVLRSVRSRIAKGLPHGRLPFGYQEVYDPTTGAPLSREVDPANARIVAEIVRRMLAGDAAYAIAQDLNGRAVPTPSDVVRARRNQPADPTSRWSIEAVRRIAANPTYAALRMHNGSLAGEGTWPAIVSQADHLRMLAVLTDPQRRTYREAAATKHLLSGIAECGVCGAKCRLVKTRGVPTYGCSKNFCVGAAQASLDGYVAFRVVRRLEDPAYRESLEREDEPEVPAAAAELEQLEARMEAFYASAEEPDGISPETLARMEAKYLPLIEDARSRSVPAAVPSALRDGLTAPDATQWWLSLPPAARRRVVRALMVVQVNRSSKPGSKVFDPSRISVEWL